MEVGRKKPLTSCCAFAVFFSVPIPRSPQKGEAKLEDVNEDMKTDGDGDAKVKAEDGDDAAKKEEPAAGDDASMQDLQKQDADAAEEKPVKTQGAAVENNAGLDSETKATQEDLNGKPNEDTEAKKGDEDSIMVPGNPYALLIKSLSPEISRADLEAVR